MLDWINAHLSTILWLAGVCVGGFIVVSAIVAVVLVRVPPDAFSTQKADSTSGHGKLLRNIAGWLLIVAGLVMLALPGPGMLVVLMGVMLADFPGKQRLMRWIISRGAILKTANKLRARFDKPPLIIDTKQGATDTLPPASSHPPQPT